MIQNASFERFNDKDNDDRICRTSIDTIISKIIHVFSFIIAVIGTFFIFF